MKTEKRFCTCCDREVLHDIFASIWNKKTRTRGIERLFFGVVTIGLSEASTTRYARCQRCQHTVTVS